MDDARLMLKYRDGDRAAFEILYRRRKGPLYRYVLRQVRSAAAAADIFQEVRSRLIGTRSRYEPRAKFATILFHIGHNCTMDHFRRDRLRRFDAYSQQHDSVELQVPDHQQPDRLVELDEQHNELVAGLAMLPAEQREAFVLHAESGFNVEDIARATAVPVATPKRTRRPSVSRAPIPMTRSTRSISDLRNLAVSLFLVLTTLSAHGHPVLMISVDGMKPEYVTDADAHGLKIPFLRSLLRDGSHARGVIGVQPTVTYPSHTTLVTGVAPAVHGIYNNPEFDPRRKFAEEWYWYADQIRAPTLWQAAHRAHLRTASVSWPVSVGDTAIDVLIPEYWRIFQPTADLNPSDRLLIAALSRPEGMMRERAARLGPYLMGNDTSIEGDEIRTRYSADILRRDKPRFTTVHLSSLDGTEHDNGPFSAAANQNMEAVDAMLAQLAQAARAADPRSVVIIVSDHGFVAVQHRINLAIPFLQAGLIDATVNTDGKSLSVNAWSASPWAAGGSAAVVLRDPSDAEVMSRTRELLRSLAADPANGIDKILEGDALKATGGFPTASFLVLLRAGYYCGANTSGALVTEFSGNHGGHGFSADLPDMRSTFIAAGPDVARHRDLGVIDMRQIAPTVAAILGVRLPGAAFPSLDLRP